MRPTRPERQDEMRKVIEAPASDLMTLPEVAALAEDTAQPVTYRPCSGDMMGTPTAPWPATAIGRNDGPTGDMGQRAKRGSRQ